MVAVEDAPVELEGRLLALESLLILFRTVFAEAGFDGTLTGGA